MKRSGRPPLEFNQAIANRICEQIVEGKSLRRICSTKGMPSLTTVMKWLRETPEFAQQYARAREEQADGYADELIDLARKATQDNAQAIRVRADVIKWVCSKLKPRKYGDRVDLAVDREEQGGAVVQREFGAIETARRMIFVMRLAERDLERMDMPQLARLLQLEARFREVGWLPALPAVPENEVHGAPED